MAYHPLLIEILVGINQQDTPSSSNRHTPEMTISQDKTRAFSPKPLPTATSYNCLANHYIKLHQLNDKTGLLWQLRV
jgi:hypothetical protein